MKRNERDHALVKMVSQLKRFYCWMVCPASAGLLFAGGAKEFNLIELPAVPEIIQPLLLVLAAVTSIAAPLMVRTLFAHSLKNSSGVDGKRFLKFQRHLMGVALLTPWLVTFVMVFEFQKFHASSIILMALYSVYYYYPSERRIAFDRKIFRVK